MYKTATPSLRHDLGEILDEARSAISDRVDECAIAYNETRDEQAALTEFIAATGSRVDALFALITTEVQHIPRSV